MAFSELVKSRQKSGARLAELGIVNASSSKNHAAFQYPAYFLVDMKTNVKCLKVKYF